MHTMTTKSCTSQWNKEDQIHANEAVEKQTLSWVWHYHHCCEKSMATSTGSDFYKHSMKAFWKCVDSICDYVEKYCLVVKHLLHPMMWLFPLYLLYVFTESICPRQDMTQIQFLSGLQWVWISREALKIGNRYGDTIKQQGQDCLHFTQCYCLWERDASNFFPPAIDK